MSKTYRRDERPAWSRKKHNDVFRCRHCKALVVPIPSGGKHRNHCPFCLYSRHVDARRPGDRASLCGASMMPVGVFTRRNGEHALVHRCMGCGCERHNRIAADDDFAYVLSLPDVTSVPLWEMEAAA